ncbi:hypothetical protein [Rhodoferax sp.]|nr:hypothetical protein [Rhodoferax sp.]
MFAFFLAVRVLRAALIALRTIAGILIIGHGIHRWAQNRSR